MNKYIPLFLIFLAIPLVVHAQEETGEQTQEEEDTISLTITTPTTKAYIGQALTFDISQSHIPDTVALQEVYWDFGDRTQTTGHKVNHDYDMAGTYTVIVTVTTDKEVTTASIDITVFKYVTLLIVDSVAPEDDIELKRQQAEQNNTLLLVLRTRSSGPEVVVEENLTNQLIDTRDALSVANVIATWTSGSVGANVLSKFAQHTKQAEESLFSDIQIERKGVVMLSDTPLGVLAPSAQSAFNQLGPSYILLTKPEALDLLLSPISAEEAKEAIFSSPFAHRILGPFSSRTVRDIGPTNFLTFGIDFLVNQGVPINSITLILMLPVIATILSFSRQVIGIKAFGIVTPAMTTLSLLVMGLQYGLIVFFAVLLAGTLTRFIMRTLHLLYLPRMALVLTSVSLAILLLFGLGVATDNTILLSFSIFPILILMLLAEEFIALQFKSGLRHALTITAWTLALAIGCFFIVSWELLRTVVISYPEVVLLTIPFNILLGRWSGLRLTEYFRFRKLLRYST